MSPPKSWQFGVIIVTFGILSFACSRLLLGESLTIDEIVFFKSDSDSESVFETFLQHCSRCLQIACLAGHEPLHVIDKTCGSKHCQAVLDHLSLFISWDLLLGGSKGVKVDALDKDYLPWLAMRHCAISIHENRFKFKSGSWPLHRSHYFSLYFHDREVTIFVTWAVMGSYILVLNNQSNVFFANVGSQAEAWRYNSTFDRVQHGATASWLR